MSSMSPLVPGFRCHPFALSTFNILFQNVSMLHAFSSNEKLCCRRVPATCNLYISVFILYFRNVLVCFVS